MSPSIRVLVVDDHRVVRDGLEQLLRTAADLELVGSVANGEEAVAFVDQHDVDVVIMDLSMPVMDGVQATRQIRALRPDCKIVVLTSFGEHSRIVDALDAGADGYLLKHADPQEIFSAVRAAAAGGAPLDPQVARTLLSTRTTSTSAAGQLTAREHEVLELVASGLANKQIARKLGISERTVKAHLTNIFQRIGVTDRTQAALWARKHLG